MAAYFLSFTYWCVSHIHVLYVMAMKWSFSKYCISSARHTQVYPIITQPPAHEKHSFSIAVHPFSVD